MKKYWERTHGKTGIIFLFIICLILIGFSLFYNWLYAVSIPLSLFFIYNLFQDYSQTMERVRGNEKYNELEPVRHQMNLFINEMNKMPDWYKIIQARGNGHAMFEKDMGIKVNDYEYWANAHKDEYMLKYNEGNLDVEGVKLRIKKFGYIASELEKVIKIADELKLNTTPEIFNDYCAARASVLGAEYALKEIIKNPTAKKPEVKPKKDAYHELIKKSDTNLENELSELNETFGDDIFDIFCQHTSLTRESLKKTLLTDLKKSLADGGKYMTESGKSLKDFSQESMDTSVEFIAKNNFDEGLGAVKTLLHKPIFHLANPDFFLNTYGYIKIERGETKEGLFLAIKCIYFSKFSIKNNLYSSDIDFQNLIVNALDTFAFGLTNLKEYSDALVLYNKVIDLAPNHSEIAEHFTNRGKCKVRLGDFKGARIDFKKGNYI